MRPGTTHGCNRRVAHPDACGTGLHRTFDNDTRGAAVNIPRTGENQGRATTVDGVPQQSPGQRLETPILLNQCCFSGNRLAGKARERTDPGITIHAAPDHSAPTGTVGLRMLDAARHSTLCTSNACTT